MSDAVDIALGLLGQMTKLLRRLSPEQLDQLADGTAKIAFIPPGHRVSAPAAVRATRAALDVSELAASVRAMDSADEVIHRLSRDRSVTVPVIDELAAVLHISLPRGQKQRKIEILAESLVGYRESAAAVMGDAYRR